MGKIRSQRAKCLWRSTVKSENHLDSQPDISCLEFSTQRGIKRLQQTPSRVNLEPDISGSACEVHVGVTQHQPKVQRKEHDLSE